MMGPRKTLEDRDGCSRFSAVVDVLWLDELGEVKTLVELDAGNCIKCERHGRASDVGRDHLD